jgi:predicted ester cyclase
MSNDDISETAKAVIRRNTEEVQSGGDYALYDELFSDNFVDHTPQPGRTSDKAGALGLYQTLRAAFPDFHAVIHWQAAEGNLVTTYKTYHGTQQGDPRHRAHRPRDPVRDRRRHALVDGKITEHWGVANLFSLMKQLGVRPGTP